MSRRAHICPTCRRPFPPHLVVHGPVRQRIVDVIANRPDGITRAELLDVVYADDVGGGPDNPNTIAVLIKNANKELEPQGYRIEPSWRGRGARYHLTRIEPQAAATATIDRIFRGFRDAQLRMRRERCADCGVHWADPPSSLCPGCEAYREHQR